NMIERFAACAGGFHSNLQIFFDAILANVIGEGGGANARFNARVFIVGVAGDQTIAVVLHWARSVSAGRADFCMAELPRICSAARRRDSKSELLAARDFSTAFSTERSSYPRLTSAEA